MGVLYARVAGAWAPISGTATGGGGGGPGGPVAYVHNQGTIAASWLVEHSLGFFPNVTVIDSGGTTCEGDVGHIDDNTLTIQFSAAFTGTAYLS